MYKSRPDLDSGNKHPLKTGTQEKHRSSQCRLCRICSTQKKKKKSYLKSRGMLAKLIYQH